MRLADKGRVSFGYELEQALYQSVDGRNPVRTSRHWSYHVTMVSRKEKEQRGRDLPRSKQDWNCCSRTLVTQRTVSAMAASAREDNERGLDDSNSRDSSYISDDDGNSDSDEGIERGSGPSDDKDDDRRLENRKQRGRGWLVMEEQRLKAYRKHENEWS